MCLAIPGRVEEVFEKENLPMGRIDFGGLSRTVCLFYVPQAKPGDYVLVHVGFAISIVDQAEAERSLSLLEELAGMRRDELLADAFAAEPDVTPPVEVS